MVATAVHVSMHAQRAKERIEQHRNGQLVSLIVALCTPMQVQGQSSLTRDLRRSSAPSRGEASTWTTGRARLMSRSARRDNAERADQQARGGPYVQSVGRSVSIAARFSVGEGWQGRCGDWRVR